MTKLIIVIIFSLSGLNISTAQWVTQFATNNCSAINSIDSYDSLISIATGFSTAFSEGRIFRTTNGGSNWEFCVIPDSTNTIHGIKITTNNTFYSWGSVKENVLDVLPQNRNAVQPYGLKLLPEGTSYGGVFMVSGDTARSWRKQGTVPSNIEYFISMDFLNSNYGFANCSIGNQNPVGAIVKTVNGGLNWQFVNLPTSSYYMYSIKVLDSMNIVSVGSKYTEIFPNQIYTGIIFKSSDAGSTWTYQLFPDVNIFTALEFINASTGIAVGNGNPNAISAFGGSMYKTTNGGQNWLSVSSNITDTSYLREVKFLPNGMGIVTGNKMRYVSGTGMVFDKISILKTTNFGTTWNRYFINDNTKVPNGLEIVTAQKYFVGGGDLLNSSAIFYTSSGGETFIHSNANELPSKISLSQNYPNPFNPSTQINYELQITNYVILNVYDINGKLVKELVNKKQSAGSYSIDFDGRDLPSGTYIYRLQAGDFSETKKMVLLK